MARLSEEQYQFALTNAREEERHVFARTANLALLDAHDRAEAAEARVRELEAKVGSAERFERAVNEALNSGDGSYQP